MIGNLLSNAIKYSDPARPGGAGVILGIVCLPNRLRIDVVDNGVGIAEADWARVFTPFVQLHNDERDREKGVGLGLSIVNAIIPLLGEHRLDMRSREGIGTRFSLELPHGDPVPDAQLRVEVTPAPGPDRPVRASMSSTSRTTRWSACRPWRCSTRSACASRPSRRWRSSRRRCRRSSASPTC